MDNDRNLVPDGSVVITLEEYSELLADSNLCYMLVNGLIEKSCFSTIYDGLSYDGRVISAILETSHFANRYRLRLKELSMLETKK